MNNTIQKLENLRDRLDEKTFDLTDFLIEIQEIDEGIEYRNIYNSFGFIVEMDEIKEDTFNTNIMQHINNIKEYRFVDLKTLEGLNFDDIILRINLVIEGLY